MKLVDPKKRDKWCTIHYNPLKPFLEEEPGESKCRATPFCSSNFYDDTQDIDESEQLVPDANSLVASIGSTKPHATIGSTKTGNRKSTCSNPVD